MPRRDEDPNFIEAIARGFDVIKAFDPHRPVMTLSEVATGTDLARPTARRILLTLESLGYVRSGNGGFALTPRVLELGLTYVQALGLWDIARPHMERLVARSGVASTEMLARYHDAWDHAAARTPHGQPIELRPDDFP